MGKGGFTHTVAHITLAEDVSWFGADLTWLIVLDHGRGRKAAVSDQLLALKSRRG